LDYVKLTIMGSGGATTTPRPFCRCSVCRKAKEVGEPYKRNSSSLFVDDICALIDCGEDIGDSLNRRHISKVDSLFITHWHPDHTFGLRPLLEAYYDMRESRPRRQVTIYIPRHVFEDLKRHYPGILHFTDHEKVASIQHIEHGESVTLGRLRITAVGYKGKDSRTFAYLLQERKKRALYAPCDTIDFEQEIFDLDFLINECGLFSYRKVKKEISFPALMKRIRHLRPKKAILTHIEEEELRVWGWDYLDKMKKRYSDINFDFAHDGMKVDL